MDSEWVDFEIYNSGDGLEYHIAHENDLRKFKTRLRVRVPKTSLNEDFIKSLLLHRDFTSVDQSYRAILDLEGAQPIEEPASPWQTCQTTGNCTWRCVLTLLKNNLPEDTYRSIYSKLLSDVGLKKPWQEKYGKVRGQPLEDVQGSHLNPFAFKWIYSAFASKAPKNSI